MHILHSLYPYGLAAANMAGGWLLYDVLDTAVGAILMTVGVIIILAVIYDRIWPAAPPTQSVSPNT